MTDENGRKVPSDQDCDVVTDRKPLEAPPGLFAAPETPEEWDELDSQARADGWQGET